MLSKGFLKWVVSQLIFLLVASNFVDPEHAESFRGILELATVGVVSIIGSIVYGYEIIYKIKNPKGADSAWMTIAKKLLSKVFVTEKAPPQ